MAKIELDDVTNIETSTSLLNSNFTKIASALNNKVLWRDNPAGTPNHMFQDLDMNGYSVYNTPDGSGGGGTAPTTLPANKVTYVPRAPLTQPNVQDALDQLVDIVKDIDGGGTIPPVASQIPIDPIDDLIAANVQAALELIYADLKDLQGGQGIPSVANIAALRTYDRQGGTIVYVKSHSVQSDGGHGMYAWVNTPMTDYNGGAVAALGGGTWILLREGDGVNVKCFGAKGDDVTDCTAAFNNARDYLIATTQGGTLYLPKGVYRVTQFKTTITNISDTAGIRIGIIGEGPNQSVIRGTATLTNTNAVVQFVANVASGMNSLIAASRYRDFGIVAPNLSTQCLRFEEMAYLELENVWCKGGDAGLYLRSVLSSSFINCRFIENRLGMVAQQDGGFSLPNQISFFQCVWGSNTTAGMVLTHPGGIRVYGGSVENNNTSRVAVNSAVQISHPTTVVGANVPALFSGVYFEDNYGTADVYVSSKSAKGLSVSFDTCSFGRTSANPNNNPLVFDAAGGLGVILGKVDNCNFHEIGGFSPNTLQKYIKTIGNVEIVQNNNWYESGLAKPYVSANLTSEVRSTTYSKVRHYVLQTGSDGTATVYFPATAVPAMGFATPVDDNLVNVRIARLSSASTTSATFYCQYFDGTWKASPNTYLQIIVFTD